MLRSSGTARPLLQINLIAPPLYVVTATCLDRAEGLTALKNVIDKIKIGIDKHRGIFKIKMEPKVVTDMDDVTLKVISVLVRDIDRHVQIFVLRKQCNKPKRRIVNVRAMTTKIRTKMKVTHERLNSNFS